MKPQRATKPKDVQFVMRLSEDDKAKLTELSAADDLPAAEIVRKLIRREHAKMEAKR